MHACKRHTKFSAAPQLSGKFHTFTRFRLALRRNTVGTWYMNTARCGFPLPHFQSASLAREQDRRARLQGPPVPQGKVAPLPQPPKEAGRRKVRFNNL